MHRIFGKQSRKGLMVVAAGVFAVTAFASGATAAPPQVEARKAAMAKCGHLEGKQTSPCKSFWMGKLRDQAEFINNDYKACLDAGGARSDCKNDRDDDWNAWTANL